MKEELHVGPTPTPPPMEASASSLAPWLLVGREARAGALTAERSPAQSQRAGCPPGTKVSSLSRPSAHSLPCPSGLGRQPSVTDQASHHPSVQAAVPVLSEQSLSKSSSNDPI